jgi:transcriptional regulator with XRE-family HTH domain
MTPNREYIADLIRKRGWSANKLAMRMGVSRAEVSRFLNGKRTGGKKLIGGLLKAFPEESVEALFILPEVEPNVNTDGIIVSFRERTGKPPLGEGKRAMKPVKHPNAHHLACSIDEATGTVEIVKGRLVTTLLVPPGHIEVRHTTKQANDTS